MAPGPDQPAISHRLLRLCYDGTGTSCEADAKALDVINEKHTSIELLPGDVVIFEDYAAVDVQCRDRSVRLTVGFLEQLVPCYKEGRTVLLNHDVSVPVGATFDADLVEKTVRGIHGTWLRVRHYAVTKNAQPQRIQAITDMLSGVLRYTSVSVMGGDWRWVKSADRYDIFPSNDVEAVELSRVCLGALPGAGTAPREADVRSANAGGSRPEFGKSPSTAAGRDEGDLASPSVERSAIKIGDTTSPQEGQADVGDTGRIGHPPSPSAHAADVVSAGDTVRPESTTIYIVGL